MNDFTKYFKEQLEKSQASDGDYLKDKSFDEAVKQFMDRTRHTVMDETLTPREKTKSREEAEEYINGKIQEWKDHEGQKLLFFLLQQSPTHVEIVKVWESDLEKTLKNLTFLHMATAAMPAFKA